MRALHNIGGMISASGLLHRPRCHYWPSSHSDHTRFNNRNKSRRNVNHVRVRRWNRAFGDPSVTASRLSVSAAGAPSTSITDTVDADNDVPTTLLIGSQQDAASCAIMNALLSRGEWLPTPAGQESTGREDGQAWTHAIAPHVSLWSVAGRLLDLDDADQRWTGQQEPKTHTDVNLTGVGRRRRRPSDVVFLSRHVAKSGEPALCVHPIGLPDPSASTGAGGKPGRCPPPSPRLAGCLRELRRAAREAGLESSFDATLEVTHHGPWLETPAMFVEIGSSEEHWGRADAAEVWANVLIRLLGLDGSQPVQENWASLDATARAERTVFVGLGGGHYAPRHGDLARLEGRFLGHMLASYSLNFGEGGRWREAVTEAVRSTRAAFPGADGGVQGGVAALVDKKSFKSADRTLLLEHLAAIGVEYRYKSSEC